MKPTDLVLRCYAREDDSGQWSAVCIDLGLAAQGDNFEEAKVKLDEQVKDYLSAIFAEGSEESQHARELLSRKAPISQRLTYHSLKLQHHFRRVMGNHFAYLFDATLPVRFSC